MTTEKKSVDPTKVGHQTEEEKKRLADEEVKKEEETASLREKFPTPKTAEGRAWLNQKVAEGEVPSNKALQTYEAQFDPEIDYPVGSTMWLLGWKNRAEYQSNQGANVLGPSFFQKGRFELPTDWPSTPEELAARVGGSNYQAERQRLGSEYMDWLSDTITKAVQDNTMTQESADIMEQRAIDMLSGGYLGTELPMYTELQKRDVLDPRYQPGRAAGATPEGRARIEDTWQEMRGAYAPTTGLPYKSAPILPDFWTSRYGGVQPTDVAERREKGTWSFIGGTRPGEGEGFESERYVKPVNESFLPRPKRSQWPTGAPRTRWLIY